MTTQGVQGFKCNTDKARRNGDMLEIKKQKLFFYHGKQF